MGTVLDVNFQAPDGPYWVLRKNVLLFFGIEKFCEKSFKKDLITA